MTDLLMNVFSITTAIALIWLIGRWLAGRFYPARLERYSVHLSAIDTLIIYILSFAIFWVAPEIFALLTSYGADLPTITQWAVMLYPYILLLPLAALLILFLFIRTQHTQTRVVLSRWLQRLLVLASGMSIFYLAAMYAPMMRMCGGVI